MTVVVPTYRPSEHLDDLVAGLDAQTMPQSDIEVLLIDDGSPDDTVARLERIASTRPNYRVIAMEPSGWPSRPRNHGIDEARGEYIVFIDHDDRLFPDGLRAAYDLASRAGADVLDGKESKSNSPGWAMRDLEHDVENAIDWIEPHPLLPMNPHKMFRTAFLREKGIRFPEGGRQIWEDISFDISAHARAEVVSLLVETPFYYWNRPKNPTTSASFQNDLTEYLAAIWRVFEWVDTELGTQPRFAELYPRFLAYQLRMRVLPLYARSAERTEAEWHEVRQFTTRLLARVPEVAETHLDPWRRIKVALLRAERFDLVTEHEPTVPRLACVATTHDPRWDQTGLTFDADVEWQLRQDAGPAVRLEDGRFLLNLSPAVQAFADDHGLTTDVTADLREASYAIERRSRTQKIDWGLVHGLAPAAEDPASGALIRGRVPVRWDVVGDPRLHPGAWDFHIRTVILWTRIVRAIKTDIDAPRWAAIDGHLVALYRSQAGNLAVDVDQRVLSVADSAVFSAEPSRAHAHLRADISGAVAHGELNVVGAVIDGRGRTVGASRVYAGSGSLAIEADVPIAVPVRFAFGDTVTGTRWRVTASGEVLRQAAVPARPSLARRLWNKVPSGGPVGSSGISGTVVDVGMMEGH